MLVGTPWASLAEARAVWPDAVDIPDDVLFRYLDAGHHKCEAYAPTPYVSPVPEAWIQANINEARELFTAYQRTNGSDTIGFDAYAVRARPLSAVSKSLLRPPRGRPRVW